MADVNYPNTISFWIKITGIPFEDRVEDIYKLIGESGQFKQLKWRKGVFRLTHETSRCYKAHKEKKISTADSNEKLNDLGRLSSYKGAVSSRHTQKRTARHDNCGKSWRNDVSSKGQRLDPEAAQ